MNQEAIGKFISACRKDKGLTQLQLAEKLNITNRAVSKWETGKSCPDASFHFAINYYYPENKGTGVGLLILFVGLIMFVVYCLYNGVKTLALRRNL